MDCWRRRAQRRRAENERSKFRATILQQVDQSRFPRDQSASGSAERNPPSTAIDMPLPVRGGIMVRASPIRTPDCSDARRGRKEMAETLEKESSSQRTPWSRR